MKKIVCVLVVLIITLMLTGCNFFSGNDSDDLENFNVFHDGLLGVELDEKWGYIDKNGEIAIDFLYDAAGFFYDGKALVVVNDEYQLIDKDGKNILDKSYDYLLRNENGILIYVDDNKYGIMDEDGELITDTLFDHIDSFNEGLARVEINEKYGFINSEGEIIISVELSNAWSVGSGVIRVYNDDDEKYGYYNTEGELVIDYLYDFGSDFDEYGYAIVSIYDNDLNYLINTEGEIMFSEFEIGGYGPYYYTESLNGEYEIVDENGDAINNKTYTNVWSIQWPFANVEYNDEDINVRFDEDGSHMLEAPYDDSDFSNDNFFKGNLIFMEHDENYIDLYINDDPLIRFEADYLVQLTEDGYFILLKNGKCGILDNDKNIVVDFLYDWLIQGSDGYVLYELNGKYGLLDSNFETLITAQYNSVATSFNIFSMIYR